MKEKKTIYINWDACFVTANLFEATEKYLERLNMTLESYAISRNIVYNYDELTNQKRAECYNQIIFEIKQGRAYDNWEVKTL